MPLPFLTLPCKFNATQCAAVHFMRQYLACIKMLTVRRWMRNCHIGIFIGAMYPVLEWGGMQAGDSSECCSHASVHHVSCIRDGWWLESPSILTSMFTSAFSLLKAHSEIVKAFVGTFNKESPNIVNINVHECHNWLMATLRQYRELSPARAGVPWPGVPSVPQQVILSYITRPCQPCHRSHSSAAQHLPTHSITVLPLLFIGCCGIFWTDNKMYF